MDIINFHKEIIKIFIVQKIILKKNINLVF